MRVVGIAFICAVLAVAGAAAVRPVNVPFTGWLLGSGVDFGGDSELQARVTLPPGYRINIYATGIEDARFMQLTPTGDLLVTSTDEGNVVLVKRDANGDGRGDGVEVLESGLTEPHGIWLDGRALYIAEEHQVRRYSYDYQSRVLGSGKVVLEGLPAGDGHHTRTVKKGPDGWFYVSIGSSCNVCIEDHPWRAAIIRFKPDGTAPPEIYATGLRNTVGFDWQPGTGLMYGVNNGRDWLGDDFPPEELNQITQGGFYGWPYFNADNVPDEDHGNDPEARTFDPIRPVHMFKAHVAPLGITFLKHQSGTPLEGAALVGQHGSWNSTVKVGYRVVSLHWDGGTITQRAFAEGFEKDDDVIGRPVDIIDAPDGTLYISDDYAGAIYRVTYDGG